MQMKEKPIPNQHLDVIVGFVPLIDVFHDKRGRIEQRSVCNEGTSSYYPCT
jgi:hypothetical protein